VSQNGSLRFSAGCCECSEFLYFLNFFVKMRLRISFVGVQKSNFLDLRIKSYRYLKFLGEVWAAPANQKTFYFLTFVGWIFFIDS
jgi:hypothetical protein